MHKTAHYPSEMACRALAVEPAQPDPPAGFTQGICIYCGRPIDTTSATKWEPSGNFTDYQYLITADHMAICIWCGALKSSTLLSKLSKCVVSDSGFLSLAPWDNVRNFFKEPPDPPFVVCYNPVGKVKPAHLFWKAPITLDRDFIVVQLGNMIVTVRRPVLLEVIEALKATGKFPVETSPTISTEDFGALKKRLREKEIPAEIRKMIENLTHGEVWALSFFRAVLK